MPWLRGRREPAPAPVPDGAASAHDLVLLLGEKESEIEELREGQLRLRKEVERITADRAELASVNDSLRNRLGSVRQELVKALEAQGELERQVAAKAAPRLVSLASEPFVPGLHPSPGGRCPKCNSNTSVGLPCRRCAREVSSDSRVGVKVENHGPCPDPAEPFQCLCGRPLVPGATRGAWRCPATDLEWIG